MFIYYRMLMISSRKSKQVRQKQQVFSGSHKKILDRTYYSDHFIGLIHLRAGLSSVPICHVVAALPVKTSQKRRKNSQNIINKQLFAINSQTAADGFFKVSTVNSNDIAIAAPNAGTAIV